MRLIFTIAVFVLLFSGSRASAQESPVIPDADPVEGATGLPRVLPVKLDISRRFLKDFPTDETAQQPYLTGDGSLTDFTGAFTLGAPTARFVPIWEPLSCRLVGVLDLQSPQKDPVAKDGAPATGAPYRLLAAGLNPTSAMSGATGNPAYFGVRIVGGKPEFLYTHGSLAVAEMIWLEDEGLVMKQRFSFRKGVSELKLTFPENWIPLITPSLGEWKGNVLSASADSISEVTLHYRLDSPLPEETEKEDAE